MFLLLFSVVFFCWLIYRRKGNFKGSLPPAYPGSVPVIGHAHLLVGDGKQLWSLIRDIQKDCLKNGGIIHCRMGPEMFYVICDPDDYFTVMGACLEKNYFYRNILVSWIGEGLVTASVPVWKKHQKLLYPAFGQQVVDGFIGVQNSQARILVSSLAGLINKGPFDHLDYISRSALETNFLTAFGLELNKNNVDKMEIYMKSFMQIRRIMTKRIQSIWMHNNFVYSWTELKKQQDEALKKIRALSDEIIQRKRIAMKDNIDAGQFSNQDKRFKCFMDLILELSEEGALSDAEIRAEVDTMLLAGFDTSSTTMAYACVLLGSYPDVQEKVYSELKGIHRLEQVFGGSDVYRDAEKQDLSRLLYLDAVLKEVGRLYPVAPVVIRYLDKDVKLRKPYAVTLMKITLSHLLRHYRIKADHKTLELQLEIFLKPAQGCQISLEPRHEKLV